MSRFLSLRSTTCPLPACNRGHPGVAEGFLKLLFSVRVESGLEDTRQTKTRALSRTMQVPALITLSSRLVNLIPMNPAPQTPSREWPAGVVQGREIPLAEGHHVDPESGFQQRRKRSVCNGLVRVRGGKKSIAGPKCPSEDS